MIHSQPGLGLMGTPEHILSSLGVAVESSQFSDDHLPLERYKTKDKNLN